MVLFFLPCQCFHSGGCYFAHLTEETTKGHSDPLPQVVLSLTELSLGSGWLAGWLAPGQFFPPDPVTPPDQLGRGPGKPPHSTCCPLAPLDQQWSPSLSLASLLLASTFCLRLPNSQRHLSQVVDGHIHPSSPRYALKKPRGGCHMASSSKDSVRTSVPAIAGLNPPLEEPVMS